MEMQQNPKADTMNANKQTALQALAMMSGDDLARAKLAFGGMTPIQMQEQHGLSGKTRAQVLAEYEAFEERVNSAIKWIDSL